MTYAELLNRRDDKRLMIDCMLFNPHCAPEDLEALYDDLDELDAEIAERTPATDLVF